jgi:hypothetical protein
MLRDSCAALTIARTVLPNIDLFNANDMTPADPRQSAAGGACPMVPDQALRAVLCIDIDGLSLPAAVQCEHS